MERGGLYPPDVGSGLNRQTGSLGQQLGESENGAKRFIEFVSDTSGELADGGEAVGMAELGLKALLFSGSLPTVYDEANLACHFVEKPLFFVEKRRPGP